LIFTPISLLQLARGGIEDKNTNGRILRLIGEEKYRTGDLQGAIRCFEASLFYLDEPEVNEQLRALYRSQSTGAEYLTSGLSSFFIFPAIAILFAGIGIFVGFVDFLVQWTSSFVAIEFPIYIIILLQVPFVILVFFCIVLLSQVLQAAIRFTRSESILFLTFASTVIVLLFFMGIIAGGTFGNYLSYIINGFQEPWSETWITLIAILTRGSFYVFSPAAFRNNLEGTMLFAGLLLLSITFALLVLVPRVRDLSRQHARRKHLQNTGGQAEFVNSLPGWVGLMGIVLVLALLFVATPQKSSVDTLEAFDHFGLAIGHVISGENDQAISEYKLGMELKPGFPLGYAGLGYAHYYSGDLDQAKMNFQKALDLAPETVDAHTGLGWVSLEEGNNKAAEMNFQKALQSDSQNLDAHMGMGWVYLNEYKIQESRKEFESVIAMFPDTADAHFGLGSLYLVVNDYDRALDSLNTAIRLNPNHIYSHVFAGNAYLYQGLYSDAEQAFQNVLKLQPDNYDALIGLAQIRIDTYKFFEGTEYYDKAISSDPNRIEGPFGKASILVQMGKFEEAASIIESLPQEDEYTLPTLAYIYYQMNRKSDADGLLRDAVDQAGRRAGIGQTRAYIAIAGVLASTNNFPDAKHYLDLAKDSFPIEPDSDFYTTFSYFLASMGKFEEAEAALQQAAQIGHSELSLHLAKADILIEQEKLADAKREIQDALQIDKTSAGAHSLLSFVLYQQGDFERAIQETQEAIRLNPYDSNAYTQLAFAYQATGRPEVAILVAREAIRLDTLNGLSHYILGVCSMEMGMNADAIAEFENFLNNYWDRAYVRDYKLKAEEYLAQLRQLP
jgi:tetratricopeptide (TPR) repeat protein